MRAFSMKWEGELAKQKVRRGAANGLHEGTDLLLEASLDVVPRENDDLANSAGTDVDEQALEASVYYNQGRYDIIQHEKLDLRHAPGETSKYLERPMRQKAGRIIDVIAASINREMR